MDEKWIVILKRRGPLLFTDLVVWGQQHAYFKETYELDYGVRHYIYFDGIVALGLSDLLEMDSVIRKNMEHNPNFLPSMITRVEWACNNLIGWCDLTRRGIYRYQSLSNLALLELFKQYTEYTMRIMPSLNITPTIERILEEKIREAIAPKISDPSLVDFYLHALVLPSKDNFAIKELRELLLICTEIQKTPGLRDIFTGEPSAKIIVNTLREDYPTIYDDILSHVRRYGFLSMYTYEGAPLSVEDVVERIKALSGWQCDQKVQEIEAKGKERKEKADKLLQSLDLSEEAVNYIEIAREYLYFRLHRLDVIMIAGFLMRDFMEEIANRLHLIYEDLLYLTMAEIEHGLETGEVHISSDEIKERRRKYAVIYQDGEYEVLSGRSLAEREKFLKGLLKEEAIPYSESVMEIEGVTANPGKYVGPAKILLSENDVDKINEGDILVTTMTNPYYLPAIVKSKGIVTDEGGILSHAAIISREFDIPCVVGTKIATIAIHDGDIVEIEGTERGGIVRILERRGNL